MIIDAQQLVQDTEIHGSIAIVGAGAAGIVSAIELSKHFRDVVVPKSGGLEFEQATQDLYRGGVVNNTATLPSDWVRTSANTLRGISSSLFWGNDEPLDRSMLTVRRRGLQSN